MCTRNIFFRGEIRKILYGYTPLLLCNIRGLDKSRYLVVFFLFLHKNMLWVVIRSASLRHF